MNITDWSRYTTQGKIDAIRKVWQPGMSAQEICDAIPGCPSRNAIIGLFGRHADKLVGIHLRGRPKPKFKTEPAPAKAARKRTGKNQNNAAWRVQNKVRLSVVKPLPVATFGAPQVAGVDLMRLNGHRCKWPLNDGGPFLFCGETTKEGRPWCAFHATASVGQGTESERSAVRAATHTAKEAA